MNELWRVLRDPRVSITGVLLAALAVGFGLVGLAYKSVAATALVANQVPFIVSGGLIGIALIGVSLGLLSIHVDRVEAAEERRQLSALQREVVKRTRE